MSTLTASQKKYLTKAKKIIKTLDLKENDNFNAARKAIFNSPELRQLVESYVKKPIVAISAGTSRALAFDGLIDQASADFQRNNFYRDYAPTAGNPAARKSLAKVENERLKNDAYTPENIFLTEGSTGAITSLIELIATQEPRSEILIASPTYYIYKLAAQYFGLKCREVLSFKTKPQLVNSSSIDQIIKAISSKTKLIVFVNPSNPTGEVFSREEVGKLLKVAKKNDIYILADELFEDLVFEERKFVSFSQVALETNTLDQLFTVKGYSKSKNLAALRIGILISKNETMMSQLIKILEQRQCFPVASAFTGLVVLDSFLQTVELRKQSQKDKSLVRIISELKKEFAFSQTIKKKSRTELKKIFNQYQVYNSQLRSFYKELYQQSLQELGSLISQRFNTQAAFNTFLRIDKLKNVNQFDFTLNLYLLTGVKVELGPCFGWDQKQWEDSSELGFWLRLSFSQEKKAYLSGLQSFKNFVPFYLESKDQLINTKLEF